MYYNDFQDLKLSGLGLGAMRLPVIDGDDAKIDEEKTFEMVDYAYHHGINYFDTAWGYHNGNSEIVLGKALKKYPRESFNLSSKFPGYDLNNMTKVEEIFEKQLEKCQVEYFDFYLFHNVCEMNINEYLDPQYHIYDYLMEQKKNGRIKHLGFSCHGSIETMKRFLDAYGKDMEFCQIQLNYLDWSFQDAKGKCDLIRSYGIPIWVMEPLRGGRLAKIDDSYQEQLKQLRPDEDTPAWAFHFLQAIEGVTMILSGMSNMEQLKENIQTFDTKKECTKEEFKVIEGIAEKMLQVNVLPCTACHYCVSHCPQGLDIPSIISLYNEHNYTGGGFIAPMAFMAYDADKTPKNCIGCRSCEQVCPQTIKISEMMSDFSNKLGGAF